MNQIQRITLISALVLIVAFGTYVLAARPFTPEKKGPVAVENTIEDVQQVQAKEKTNADPVAPKKEGTPPQPISNAKIQASAAQTSTTHMCTAGELEGRVTMQNVGNSVAAAVTVTARQGFTCTLAGYPLISINDKRGTLSGTTNYLGTPKSITLKPGDSATSRVVWNNWCGRSNSNISFRTSFSGDKGYLLIPAVGTDGKVQNMTPICIDDHATSTVSVTGFTK